MVNFIMGAEQLKLFLCQLAVNWINECRLYINQYGSVRVGKAMHTSAGSLKPRIKYVIHAVGPNANENHDRQNCFDLVKSAVLYSLEHTEHVLEAVSISLPAISASLVCLMFQKLM